MSGELDLEALRRLTPEQLASDFHHNYETLAPHFGYRTRSETAVPWEQVPEQNKALMIAVIRSLVFEDLNLPAILAALERAERLWTCGSGHLVEIEAGVPPSDMGTCPICAALKRIPELEWQLRAVLSGEHGEAQRKRLEHAERVEVAARELLQDIADGVEVSPPLITVLALRAALAAAPAEEGE